MRVFLTLLALVLALAVAPLATASPALRPRLIPRPQAAAAASPVPPNLAPDSGLKAGSGFPPPEIIRGVNLGGWLVLEPWITPSLFEPWANSSEPAVDEFTFTQRLGPVESLRRLRAHWSSFLQPSDLHKLAAAGITHVRIPVGYWMISIDKNEPFVYGSWEYLVRALGWCEEAGLKVLIDLHGAPGSQNGFDNSGRRGPIDWDHGRANLFRTLSVLANLTEMLQPYTKANGGPVTGIELLNEPFVTVPLDFVHAFYDMGYSAVRAADPTLDVFIHDAFRLGSWKEAMQPPQYQNVYLDTHLYHVFDHGLLRMSPEQHLDYSCNVVRPQQAEASRSLWLVTGEWSLATTDCAKWLNGFQRGSRWDGTLDPSQPAIGQCTGNAGNDIRNFTASYLSFLRAFAETQMSVYENASGSADSGSAGWFFWNFKTEQSPQWDFLLGLEKGYIPNPVTSRTHSCRSRARLEEAAGPGPSLGQSETDKGHAPGQPQPQGEWELEQQDEDKEKITRE